MKKTFTDTPDYWASEITKAEATVDILVNRYQRFHMSANYDYKRALDGIQQANDEVEKLYNKLNQSKIKAAA